MSHFLFVAGALRERTSEESAELQLGHGLWDELPETPGNTALLGRMRPCCRVPKLGRRETFGNPFAV